MRSPFVALVAVFAFAAGILAQEPTTAEGYLKRGDEHLKGNATDKAIADYSQAIELDKNYARAFKQRAYAYSWTGKYDQAIADYSSAIKAGAADANIFLTRGQLYLSAGKTDLAIADYTSAIESDPKNVEAYARRGWVYTAQKIHEKAVKDFDKLVELEPTASSYSRRARIHQRAGSLKAAIADHTKAIELEPRNASHYAARADAYAESQKLDAAIDDLAKAINLDPKGTEYRMSRAVLYLRKDRPDNAIADCDAALAAKPPGDIFDEIIEKDDRERRRRLEGGVQRGGWFDDVLGADSRLYVSLVRAEAEKRKGKVDVATAGFNQVIERDLRLTGIIYLYQSKLLPDLFKFDSDEMTVEATKAIDKNPKVADAYIRRAAMTTDQSKAIKDYTTALKLAPERAAALLVCRGTAYQQLGRHASAVADYREALQLDPKSKLAEDLLNAGIAKLAEYKSKTTVESVKLDFEGFNVATDKDPPITLPDNTKKTITKSLTTKHEVTVADVRKLDVEVRSSLKQKQEATSGSSSTAKTTESTTADGGGSLGVGFLSFSGRAGKEWGTGSETEYTSSSLTGWESEFGTTVRTGMEKSKAWTRSVESTETVQIELIGKGDDYPIVVIYQDKYRSGTARLKINGVDDEVKFAFSVGKDMTWKYVPNAKLEEKK